MIQREQLIRHYKDWGLGEGDAAVVVGMTEAPGFKVYLLLGMGWERRRFTYCSCWGITDGMLGWEIRSQGMESRQGEGLEVRG